MLDRLKRAWRVLSEPTPELLPQHVANERAKAQDLLYRHIKGAHHVNLLVRRNGRDEHHEADYLKWLLPRSGER